jgi:hypothetical protein
VVLTKGPTSIAPKIPNKCGWKELDIRNNFTSRNFSRFEMEFEIKNQRTSVS